MTRHAVVAAFSLVFALPSLAHAEPSATDTAASQTEWAPTSSPAPASEVFVPTPALAPVPAAVPAPVPAFEGTSPIERPSDAAPTGRTQATTEAFTARRGFRMTTAGLALMGAGMAWTSVAGWMMRNDDPRAGLALAFAIDGAVVTTLGVVIASAGGRRARQPGVWLDRRDGRRDRLERASLGASIHTPTGAREVAVAERGERMRRIGALTLSSGFFAAVFGGGMQLAYGNGELAPRIAVPAASLPLIITGAALLAAGGRRIHHADRFVDRRSASRRSRVELAASPQLQRGGMGISLAGRF